MPMINISNRSLIFQRGLLMRSDCSSSLLGYRFGSIKELLTCETNSILRWLSLVFHHQSLKTTGSLPVLQCGFSTGRWPPMQTSIRTSENCFPMADTERSAGLLQTEPKNNSAISFIRNKLKMLVDFPSLSACCISPLEEQLIALQSEICELN